jgi:hypothetical protein
MRKEKHSLSGSILKITLGVATIGAAISYFVGYSVRSVFSVEVIDTLAGMGLIFFLMFVLLITGILVFIAGLKKGRSW